MRDWTVPCIVLDVDRTLCPLRQPNQAYASVEPYMDMVRKVQEYRNRGFYIIIHTARQMRTYECNQGLINANMLPTLIEWLDKWQIPFDEIWPDKPWCGFNGAYIDDSTVSPKDFLELTWDQIQAKLEAQR